SPCISSRSSPRGELLGAEALLRWRHPQLGDLSPAEFIPMAEETGLIHALGNWVVGAACACIMAWDRDGVPFRGRLAVNVSAWQLVQPRLAALFEAQVRAAGIEPALDDFGVGYSALSYLQRLPLDMLKIDRSFVSELTPEVARPLAGFIIDVAHRLGIVAVAEGVETEPQRHVLEQMGCDGLQGYLICRPLDDAGFRQWLGEYELRPA